jgi:hypothetical protein
MARSRKSAPQKRPQIRLQSVLLAQRPRSSEAATNKSERYELTTTTFLLTEESRYALFDGPSRGSLPVRSPAQLLEPGDRQ